MTRKEIAEFILRSRTKEGLSQQLLAHKIGKQRQAIFEIENNLVDFKTSTFLDIIDVLGFEIRIYPKARLTNTRTDIKYDFSKIEPSPSSKSKEFKKSKTKRK